MRNAPLTTPTLSVVLTTLRTRSVIAPAQVWVAEGGARVLPVGHRDRLAVGRRARPRRGRCPPTRRTSRRRPSQSSLPRSRSRRRRSSRRARRDRPSSEPPCAFLSLRSRGRGKDLWPVVWPRRRRCKTGRKYRYPRTGHAAPRCDHRRAHGRTRAVRRSAGDAAVAPGSHVRPDRRLHAARRRRVARRSRHRVPGGLYALTPVLARGTLTGGLEPVTQIERDVSATATTAGINGDFVRTDGRPSGVWIGNGLLAHPPLASRSSIGIDTAGTLHVDRVKLFGTWQGTGQRRTLERAQPTPGAGADRAVHVGVRPAHTGRRGGRGGGARRVPADRAERRSRGRRSLRRRRAAASRSRPAVRW